ncbi:MAG: class I SAM-dependent methyltransferase [Acidobacteria bacterium]|nr:class I SAM-dependent methyltransferase [Acidobacteriota bacterium]
MSNTPNLRQPELRNNGFQSSLRRFFALTWEFLRESMPDRRRQRYGDVDYDWEYRVDTTSATIRWRTRLRGLLHSPYQPVEPELFRAMLNALHIDFTRFTFIDIGSGKGRALLLASEYPFERILGVELLPELNQIARENIRKFPRHLQRCSNIEARVEDATKISFPPQGLVIFLFHPLPEADFVKFLANLNGSLETLPRPIYLLYAHPVFAGMVESCRRFKRIGGSEQYALFGPG